MNTVRVLLYILSNGIGAERLPVRLPASSALLGAAESISSRCSSTGTICSSIEASAGQRSSPGEAATSSGGISSGEGRPFRRSATSQADPA